MAGFSPSASHSLDTFLILGVSVLVAPVSSHSVNGAGQLGPVVYVPDK